MLLAIAYCFWAGLLPIPLLCMGRTPRGLLNILLPGRAAECIGRRMHPAAECIRWPNAFRGSMHSEAVCIRRQYAIKAECNQGRMQSISLLPIAYCLLPIAYCLLPIAYCLGGGPTALCPDSVMPSQRYALPRLEGVCPK